MATDTADLPVFAQCLFFGGRALDCGMQQDAPLQQGKACLSITAAFDPFHLIDKALEHAIAPGLSTPIDHSLGIISQPLDKVDQWSLTRSPYRPFPLF